MSMFRCAVCGGFVDTDDDPEALIDVSPTRTACRCEVCREAAFEEAMRSCGHTTTYPLSGGRTQCVDCLRIWDGE